MKLKKGNPNFLSFGVLANPNTDIDNIKLEINREVSEYSGAVFEKKQSRVHAIHIKKDDVADEAIRQSAESKKLEENEHAADKTAAQPEQSIIRSQINEDLLF